VLVLVYWVFYCGINSGHHIKLSFWSNMASDHHWVYKQCHDKISDVLYISNMYCLTNCDHQSWLISCIYTRPCYIYTLKVLVKCLCYRDITTFKLEGTTSVVYWLTYSPRELSIVGLSPDRVKPKTIKFVFVASSLSMQH
jgi:hypothetical protein